MRQFRRSVAVALAGAAASIARMLIVSGVIAMCIPLRMVGAQRADTVRADRWRADTSGAGFRRASAPITFADVARRIRASHPAVRAAESAARAARADGDVARGAFDPSLSASLDRKTFAGTQYFEFGSAKLSLPTPLGVDLSVGFERALGRYLNPERRVPSSGLFTAGVRIPVGQRILTDERRTAIAVADAGRDAAEADRAAVLNKTLASAAKDFAAWYETSRRLELVQSSVSLAEFRLEATRARAAGGEAAPIDTIEARLELRRRRVLAEEAAQALMAARATVETYWWDERGRPLALPDSAAPVIGDVTQSDAGATPSPWDALAIGDLADSARWRESLRLHPDVRKAGARLAQGEANERLTRQGILPNAYFELSALNAGDAAWESVSGANAKLSAGISQSLLMIRERGRIRAADARTAIQDAELARVERETAAAIRIAAAELAMVERLLIVQQGAVTDATLLQQGEQQRFDAGESTLFLVNARDRTVLDEGMKLAALEAKRLSAAAGALAALGITAGAPQR